MYVRTREGLGQDEQGDLQRERVSRKMTVRDIQMAQDSVSKIQDLLEKRRELEIRQLSDRLEEAFAEVPSRYAPRLYYRLKRWRKDDPLSRLFRKLSRGVRSKMLDHLLDKMWPGEDKQVYAPPNIVIPTQGRGARFVPIKSL